MSGLVYDVKEARSFRELIANSAADYADRPAFVFRTEDSALGEISYARFYEDIKNLSAYLVSQGLEGGRIALIGVNCYEWALSYLAIGCGVGVIVPIDRDARLADMSVMLADSEAAAVIHTPNVSLPEDCGCRLFSTAYMSDYLKKGAELRAAGDRSYEAHKVDPYAFGVLLYTSATTGVAKGVMLSQNNICSDIVAVRRGSMMTPDDRVLSVLPLHHTYETSAGLLSPLLSGGSIAYNRSLKKFSEDLKFYKPTMLIAVPLLLSNILGHVEKTAASVRGGKLVFGAAKGIAGLAGRFGLDIGERVFASVRESLGGRLRLIVCGAAPLPVLTQRDFGLFGIPVYNGYGLTETSPVCIMQGDMTPDSLGTIGLPINGVSVRLADPDERGVGEIEVSGPNVMLGYYKNPEQTARVLRDGWLRTGDLACIDRKTGYYRIVGRCKNVIVTKGGKNIFPEELEYLLEKSPAVAECMVCGYDTADGDVTVAAIIYPDSAEVEKHLSSAVVDMDSEEYREAERRLVEAAVAEANKNVPPAKAIRRYYIRREEFVKTTTHKIKRSEPGNRPDVSELCELHLLSRS